MKVFRMIMKIAAALAVVAGIVYVVVTYGDKIVAWTKKLVSKLSCLCEVECCCDGECCCQDTPEAEDVSTEEASPAEETAEEADFEG